MFQPLTAAIGLRYLRAKRRNGFISFISLASVLGIFIGVVALITTISVMTGFQEELRNRILGTVAHATVEGVDGSLADWPQAVALQKKICALWVQHHTFKLKRFCKVRTGKAR